MTPAQMARLPEVLRLIVEADRELDAIRARVVTPFDRTKRPLRELELIGLRAGYRQAAAQRWGHRISSQGPALA